MGRDKIISEIDIDGYPIKVCSPEDLIIMRLSSWREEDKVKAAAIAISTKLDEAYLRKRAAEEKVGKRLDWLMKEIREAQD
ncbi:MAG: nucleotidyltransferase [Candidatus Altiarchaeota archaeon]|nr:nucleotidyltransferase [Candidatus Altiarchaeota archaeon]